MGTYLPRAGTLGCAVQPGAGIAHSQGIPLNFYPPYVNVGSSVPPPLPLSAPPHLFTSLTAFTVPPLLLIWINVASSNPWLLDFHTPRFSNGPGCYLFCDVLVILSMDAGEGKVCLPTPPSQPEVHSCHFFIQ